TGVREKRQDVHGIDQHREVGLQEVMQGFQRWLIVVENAVAVSDDRDICLVPEVLMREGALTVFIQSHETNQLKGNGLHFHLRIDETKMVHHLLVQYLLDRQ